MRIFNLKPPEKITLSELWKNGSSHLLRKRAQILLIRDKGLSVKAISDLLEISERTVEELIKKWRDIGLAGLYDKERSGRPPIANEEEELEILLKIYENPTSLKTVLHEIKKDLKKIISIKTLKRIAKKFGLAWKRFRKSLKHLRNKKEFDDAYRKIQELILMAKNKEINLTFFDESSFSSRSNIPYGWQDKNNNFEIDSGHRGKNLNVLGFLNEDNNFKSFAFYGPINSDLVIWSIDKFVKKIQGPTVLILDNSPTHTSEEFLEKIPQWKEKGLTLYFLPKYAPELNRIEILWKFVKYHWMNVHSLGKNKIFEENLLFILKNIGKKYFVNYSNPESSLASQ